jgi:hypothetical protein
VAEHRVGGYEAMRHGVEADGRTPVAIAWRRPFIGGGGSGSGGKGATPT